MNWETIASVTGGRWAIEPSGDQLPPIGVAIDTRELKRGQAFVAYLGQHVDGHAFLSKAKGLGCALCIVSDPSKIPGAFDVPTLVVDDATEALAAMARHWRSLMQGTVIGVTGSNGKTTTTRLIHAVLNQGGKRGGAWVSSKSHNNSIGVPMSVLNSPLDAEFAIFELGTSSPGEIAARAELVEPDVSVITSIGRAHLEELGSIAGVCQEKASILRSTGTLGIIPSGVGELDKAIDEIKPGCRVERFSAEQLDVVQSDQRSVIFNLDGFQFLVPVPGLHNASNAAMAVLVGRACKMSDADIASGLSNATLPDMRLERIVIPTTSEPIVIYNDAYNANPDSMRAALGFFESIEADNKVTILGDMLELGGSAAQQHAELIEELGAMGSIGRLVLVGENWSKAASVGTVVYPKSDAYAITEIARTINPGDLILLKGSRGVGLERLVYILISRHAQLSKLARPTLVEDASERNTDE